jgi:hypothetical protein
VRNEKRCAEIDEPEQFYSSNFSHYLFSTTKKTKAGVETNNKQLSNNKITKATNTKKTKTKNTKM